MNETQNRIMDITQRGMDPQRPFLWRHVRCRFNTKEYGTVFSLMDFIRQPVNAKQFLLKSRGQQLWITATWLSICMHWQVMQLTWCSMQGSIVSALWSPSIYRNSRSTSHVRQNPGLSVRVVIAQMLHSECMHSSWRHVRICVYTHMHACMSCLDRAPKRLVIGLSPLSGAWSHISFLSGFP